MYLTSNKLTSGWSGVCHYAPPLWKNSHTEESRLKLKKLFIVKNVDISFQFLYDIRPKTPLFGLQLRKHSRGSQNFFSWKPSKYKGDSRGFLLIFAGFSQAIEVFSWNGLYDAAFHFCRRRIFWAVWVKPSLGQWQLRQVSQDLLDACSPTYEQQNFNSI